jgi:hypothetical protein
MDGTDDEIHQQLNTADMSHGAVEIFVISFFIRPNFRIMGDLKSELDYEYAAAFRRAVILQKFELSSY